jgi:hypothetical protein
MASGAVVDIVKKSDNKPPVGVWPGKWSAYTVEFETNEGTFFGHTRNGIRGADTCQVTVTEEGVSFETDRRAI